MEKNKSKKKMTKHELFINGLPIKKKSQAKFLGVIIDDQLSWEPHITALRRKLSYASATLYRIRDSLPTHLHKDLYHTLFESHLTYCISVWGGSALNKISRLWIAQKHCIRVFFGDKEAYLDKFRTASRARPFPNQLLGEDFYRREHTKPLFQKYKVMTIQNLYVYHTYMELFKILKLRSPISLYGQFVISDRKETMLISKRPANNFVSRSTKIWNIISPKMSVTDFCCKINATKNHLKKALLDLQHAENPVTWTSEDWNMTKIIKRPIKI